MSSLPPGESLLVRVSFEDEDVWRSILRAVTGADGAESHLTVVDDASWAGARPDQIIDEVRNSGRSYVLVADAASMTDSEHALLALSIQGDQSVDFQSLRILPSTASSVTDNLAIANLLLPDFAAAADVDGVYRGEQEYTPPDTLTKAELLALADRNTSTPALARFRDELAGVSAPRYSVTRINLSESHERQSGRDFRNWQTLGYDDFLAVAARGGEAEGTTVSLPRGYWEVLLDRSAGHCLAAMKVFPPSLS